jgi:hypothetical protein
MGCDVVWSYMADLEIRAEESADERDINKYVCMCSPSGVVFGAGLNLDQKSK